MEVGQINALLDSLHLSMMEHALGLWSRHCIEGK